MIMPTSKSQMYNQYIQQLIGKQNFQLYKQQTAKIPDIHQKVLVLKQLTVNFNVPQKNIQIQDFVNYLMQHKFPHQFDYQFIPDIDYYTKKTLKCDNCKQYITKHIQVKSCDHILCEKCVPQLNTQTHCPVCHEYYCDINLDKKLIKQQLSTQVFCSNSLHSIQLQQPIFCHEQITLDNYQPYQQQCPLLDNQIFQTIHKINDNQCYDIVNQKKLQFLNKVLFNKLNKHIQLEIIKQAQPFAFGSHEFQIYNYYYNYQQLNIIPCQQQLQYSEITIHLKECNHSMCKCKHSDKGCDVVLPKNLIQTHESECLFIQKYCDICFKYKNLTYKNITQHHIDCIKSVQLNQNLTQQKQPDVLVECKMKQIELKFQLLSINLLKYFTQTQQEILIQHKKYSADEARYTNQKIRTNPFLKLLQFCYLNYVVIFCVTFQFLNISIYDALYQYFSNSKKHISLIFVFLQLLNLFLFVTNKIIHLNSSLYKSSMYISMYAAYVVKVVSFAGIYSFLIMHNPDNFANIRDTQNIYSTFIDMLYFSSIAAAKSGFGDVHANTPLVRLLVFVQILLTIFVLYIIFRGGGFYFRITDLKKDMEAITQTISDVTNVLFSKNYKPQEEEVQQDSQTSLINDMESATSYTDEKQPLILK